MSEVPTWVRVYALMVRMKRGQAFEVTHHEMRDLVRGSQTWPDTERYMTDEEINAEIRTWPMFMDYRVSFNPFHRTWTVYLPKGPHHEPLTITTTEHTNL